MHSFENILTYIKHFKSLVEIERQEEMKRHFFEIRKFSPKAREKKGRAFLDMNGKADGRGLGGTYLVKFVKSRRERLPQSQISVGDLVIVTSLSKPSGKEMQGTVIEKTNFTITVSYLQKPTSYHYGKELRVDLFANDITFQRMLIALKKVKSRQQLQRILLGEYKSRETDIDGIKLDIVNKNLNLPQRNAVEKSLFAGDLFLLHGPPGTGKTTTLVESILQHSRYVKKILVTADSNTAVDNIVEKLSKYKKVNVVRVGNPARMNEDIIENSLDYLLQKEQFFTDANLLWKEIDRYKEKQKEYAPPTGENRRGLTDKQIRSFAKKRKSTRGVPAPLIRKMANWLYVNQEISELARKAKILEAEATNDILNRAEVICTTNANAGSDIIEDYCRLNNIKFDVLFIDEATQAVEPSCLVPMMFANKYILAGDHKQLPPTILSFDAKEMEYTLFERLIKLYPSLSSMLEVQYRMHENIMYFPNKQFYNGRLKADDSVKKRDLGRDIKKTQNDILDPKNVDLFIDTSENNSYEHQKVGSTSHQNDTEAQKVENIAREFVKAGIFQKEIGIITPYDDQVNLISKKIEDLGGIEVKSVDGFQGREKDVIIISFVRANEKGELGFLRDYRRLNVAITRARKKLVMIGNRKTLERNKVFKDMIDSVQVIYLDN